MVPFFSSGIRISCSSLASRTPHHTPHREAPSRKGRTMNCWRASTAVAGFILLLSAVLSQGSGLVASSNGVVEPVGVGNIQIRQDQRQQQRQQQAKEEIDGNGEATPLTFSKDFTRPMSIPEEGIEAAVAVLRSGRLFRYSCESAEASQVALAEQEFAKATGARFAVGVNSCSSAILIALLSVGVQPGDKVLTNAFTFTAVTSTVLRLGAEPVLVECGERCEGGIACHAWLCSLSFPACCTIPTGRN